MRILRRALVISAVIAATAQAAHATTLRAGEWETILDGGVHTRVCVHADQNFDEATIRKITSAHGIKCNYSAFHTLGAVTTSLAVCEIAGGHMTVNTTFTITGADAYMSRSKSHLDGGSIKVPDMDMTQTARRLGECKPGDRQAPY